MLKVNFSEWNDCVVKFDKYAMRNQTHMRLYHPEEGPICTATVAWGDYVPPSDEFTLIKNYSENEGILEALEAAGIVKRIRTVDIDIWEVQILKRN